jgi:5-methylcytosine-specific restriction endonuclease McrBC GTP-binding regulatory subunit McrB
VQLKLPLFGVAYQLHQINLSQGNRVTSEQELLLETIAHRDLESGKEVKLPAAIVKILQAKKATLKEWESAIDLYQVAGASGVLAYLEGLDSLRTFFGTKVVKSLEQSSAISFESVTIVESKL